jgi:uncharacterized protein
VRAVGSARLAAPVVAYWQRVDGSHTEQYLLETASTPEKQARGLMFRTHLPPRQGMLFIFKEDAQHSFWMKNVGIALDIAWLATSGTVLQMALLRPHDLRLIRPTVSARYAVEVAANTLQFDGVGIGARLVLTS